MKIELQDIKSVYLDTNFLIYWFFSKNPRLRKKVRLLVAYLLARDATLYVSPLTLDESWNGIRKEIDINKSADDQLIHPELQKFTAKVLSYTTILQLITPLNGTNLALDNIKQYSLKPRDSFHLAIVQQNNIEMIITSDKDFDEYQKAGGNVYKILKNHN